MKKAIAMLLVLLLAQSTAFADNEINDDISLVARTGKTLILKSGFVVLVGREDGCKYVGVLKSKKDIETYKTCGTTIALVSTRQPKSTYSDDLQQIMANVSRAAVNNGFSTIQAPNGLSVTGKALEKTKPGCHILELIVSEDNNLVDYGRTEVCGQLNSGE